MEHRNIVRATPENALADAVAALNTPDFPARLDAWLQRLAPFDNNVVLAFRGDQRPVVLYMSAASPVVYSQFSEYVEAAYLLDPFFQAHKDRIRPGFHRFIDVAPDNFKRSAYYRSYYRRTTLVDEVAAFAYTAGGFTVNLCLGKDWTSNRPFTQRDIAGLTAHERIVCALIERHWADLEAPAGAASGPRPGDTADAALIGELIGVLAHKREIQLTARQAEVALMILRGHSSRSIALHLGISAQTVKVHRKQLYARCRIGSQVELFAMLVPLIAGLTEGPGIDLKQTITAPAP